MKNLLVCERMEPRTCIIHGAVMGISFRKNTKTKMGFVCEKCLDDIFDKFLSTPAPTPESTQSQDQS